MAADLILKAASVITMDPQNPRAEAVAVDTTTGSIVTVGSMADCQALAPKADVRDLGSSHLMPGFIEPHSHPLLSGMGTQEPAYWIAPYVGYPTFEDVKQLWRRLDAELPPDQPVACNGYDRMLQGAPELSNTDLDEFFPNRKAIIVDNSGHEVYFNSAVIKGNGWKGAVPPPDPEGSSFGRNPDGTSNGRAYETAAMLIAVNDTLTEAVPHPLLSGARWYQLMASNGITATTEHTFKSELLPGYIALAAVPDSPLRVALYHMSIEGDCGESLEIPVPPAKLWKQGIKLWADGTPWVGTIAASFPYLDTPEVRAAQIPLGPGGEDMLNYSRAELDAILDKYTSTGFQFAFHVNGDVGLDVVLDAYERALAKSGLLGTDHRWRVEHCGACRGDQFARAASLGVTISLSPFQFIYWGDLLDGTMFPSEIGSQWVRAGDAFRSGAVVTFHNDGSVSPPIPLLNIQSMATRQTDSGAVRGSNQAVSVYDGFRAHTVNAAYQIGRDHDLGSIEVGKLADFVELSADPFAVEAAHLTRDVQVLGTWQSGHRIDLDAFASQVAAIDPSMHPEVASGANTRDCC